MNTPTPRAIRRGVSPIGHAKDPGTEAALPRRQFLSTLLAASSVWAAPMAWAQSSVSNTPTGIASDARLVVVLLRGAYDGLSAFVPHGDRSYYAMRPNIAIAAPDCPGSDA